jgi:tubulin polyglutamylase TTLL7
MIDMSSAKGDCFQMIGLDVFLDKNLKPWILEINESPSLNIELVKEGGVGEGLIKHPSEVDRYIKTLCMGDAYKLMIKTTSKSKEKRKERRSEIQSYGCFQRLDCSNQYVGYLKAS